MWIGNFLTTIHIPIVVGISVIIGWPQKQQKHSSILTLKNIKYLAIAATWFYYWTQIQHVGKGGNSSILPLKIFFLLSIMYFGWNDPLFWSNANNNYSFITGLSYHRINERMFLIFVHLLIEANFYFAFT